VLLIDLDPQGHAPADSPAGSLTLAGPSEQDEYDVRSSAVSGLQSRAARRFLAASCQDVIQSWQKGVQGHLSREPGRGVSWGSRSISSTRSPAHGQRSGQVDASVVFSPHRPLVCNRLVFMPFPRNACPSLRARDFGIRGPDRFSLAGPNRPMYREETGPVHQKSRSFTRQAGPITVRPARWWPTSSLYRGPPPPSGTVQRMLSRGTCADRSCSAGNWRDWPASPPRRWSHKPQPGRRPHTGPPGWLASCSTDLTVLECAGDSAALRGGRAGHGHELVLVKGPLRTQPISGLVMAL